MSIEQNLYDIIHARWGKDVRQSIHDGIEQCYTDGRAGATDLTAREAIASEVATRTSETHKQTATSTDFNLSTADGGIEVERVVGKSFKSKNLLKPTLATTTSNGVTCTNNGDGTYTLNGTATANTTFNFAVNQKLPSGTYKYICQPYKITDITATIADSTNNKTYYDGYSFTVSTDITYVARIYIANGITVNNVIYKPILTTDTSATYSDFTPYGIHSSGQYGCVDLGDLEWTKYTDNNKYCFYTTIANKKLITEKGISSDIYCEEYTVMPSSNLAGYSDNDRVIWSGASTSLGYIDVRDSRYTDVASFKSAMKGTLLAYEYSSTPSQYAEVWEEQNNAFNGWIQGQFNTTTKVFDTSANWVRTDYLPCDKSASLLFSTDTYTDGHYKRAIFFDASKTYISDSSSQLVQKLSFTTPSNCEYVIYEIAKSSGIAPSNAPTDVVMISHSKTIIFPLAEPLYKDNVVSDEGLTKKYARVDLSTLTWSNWGSGNVSKASTLPFTSIAYGGDDIPPIYADNYNAITRNQVYTKSVEGISLTGQYVYCTDASPSGYLIYPLATPTTQPLTADQLNALNSFKSFSGKTIITSQDLADAKPSVTLNYGKSDAMAKALEGVCEAKRVDATEPNNEAITDAWTSGKTYAVGSYVIHEDKLYKCLVQNVGVMPPNATYWSATSVGKELAKTLTLTITTNAQGIASLTNLNPQTETIISAEVKSGTLLIIPEENQYYIKILNYTDLSPSANKTYSIKITYLKK